MLRPRYMPPCLVEHHRHQFLAKLLRGKGIHPLMNLLQVLGSVHLFQYIIMRETQIGIRWQSCHIVVFYIKGHEYMHIVNENHSKTLFAQM
jgi:hypothetical protein